MFYNSFRLTSILTTLRQLLQVITLIFDNQNQIAKYSDDSSILKWNKAWFTCSYHLAIVGIWPPPPNLHSQKLQPWLCTINTNQLCALVNVASWKIFCLKNLKNSNKVRHSLITQFILTTIILFHFNFWITREMKNNNP